LDASAKAGACIGLLVPAETRRFGTEKNLHLIDITGAFGAVLVLSCFVLEASVISFTQIPCPVKLEIPLTRRRNLSDTSPQNHGRR